MMYKLINDLVNLVKTYEESGTNAVEDVSSFIDWLKDNVKTGDTITEPNWAGKESGRSADSVINTSLVHVYRYARSHARAAITGSSFTTPDEFIYLITLSSMGSMSKTALIRENIHEKPAGVLIINRLIEKGFVEQKSMEGDKRSRIIHITERGRTALKERMTAIRAASANVTEPLSPAEKTKLIELLAKLEDFHHAKNEK
ncbi:MAG: MarR family transcriptional regulator [Flavobacterium sp.]|nr:MAG: MarR family transcriptional regulator [Flavobacterium sp.]